jgi:hypothetical protein
MEQTTLGRRMPPVTAPRYAMLSGAVRRQRRFPSTHRANTGILGSRMQNDNDLRVRARPRIPEARSLRLVKWNATGSAAIKGRGSIGLVIVSRLKYRLPTIKD